MSPTGGVTGLSLIAGAAAGAGGRMRIVALPSSSALGTTLGIEVVGAFEVIGACAGAFKLIGEAETGLISGVAAGATLIGLIVGAVAGVTLIGLIAGAAAGAAFGVGIEAFVTGFRRIVGLPNELSAEACCGLGLIEMLGAGFAPVAGFIGVILIGLIVIGLIVGLFSSATIIFLPFNS